MPPVFRAEKGRVARIALKLSTNFRRVGAQQVVCVLAIEDISSEGQLFSKLSYENEQQKRMRETTSL